MNNNVFVRINGYIGTVLINDNSIQINEDIFLVIPVNSSFSCNLRKRLDDCSIDLIIATQAEITELINSLNIPKDSTYQRKPNILTIPTNFIINTNMKIIILSLGYELKEKELTLKQSIYFILNEFNSMGWNLSNLFNLNIDKSKKNKVTSLIKEAPDMPWTIDLISKKLNTTPSTLRRHLSKENVLFSQLLLDIRLGVSINYLTFTNYSILKVSYLSGFNSSAYFCDVFRKRYSMTPSVFRDNSRNHNDLII